MRCEKGSERSRQEGSQAELGLVASRLYEGDLFVWRVALDVTLSSSADSVHLPFLMSVSRESHDRAYLGVVII